MGVLRSRLPRLCAMAFSCAVSLAACQTPEQSVSRKEDHLSAAGFLVRPANTPERQAMLNRLPPHQFIRRMRGDSVSYIYADPLVCDCLYIGSEKAYNQYRYYVQQKHLADQQELTAQMYSDAAWDWGPWGPFGPDYGLGYGVGW